MWREGKETCDEMKYTDGSQHIYVATVLFVMLSTKLQQQLECALYPSYAIFFAFFVFFVRSFNFFLFFYFCFSLFLP